MFASIAGDDQERMKKKNGLHHNIFAILLTIMLFTGITPGQETLGNEDVSQICQSENPEGTGELLICKITVVESKPEPTPTPGRQAIVREKPVVAQTAAETFQCRLATLHNQENVTTADSMSRWDQEVTNAEGAVIVIFSQETCPGCQAIKTRLNLICQDTQQRSVERVLTSANIGNMATAQSILALSAALCDRIPLLCRGLNTVSPKFPHVKFVFVENDYDLRYGLFNDHSILFTPTIVMFYQGEKIFRVTGANVDCFELAAQIAEIWHNQTEAKRRVTSAIIGASSCSTPQSIATEQCRPDRACQRKLRKLLDEFNMSERIAQN